MGLWQRISKGFRGGKSDHGDLESDSELCGVDRYLLTSDAFAQGRSELFPRLMEWKDSFEESLAQLLEAGDRRAVKRLVFYAVVQVGASIPTDSRLGKAASAMIGAECHIAGIEEGSPRYFAGDLFLWCRAHGWHFEPFPLLDEWTRRDFAQQVAIPMYLAIRGK